MCDTISHCRNSTERFSRYNGGKYNISMSNQLQTFLDSLCTHLLSIDAISEDALKIQQMIVYDEYDTESVDIDLEILMNDGISNLSGQVKNEQVIEQMLAIFQKFKS